MIDVNSLVRENIKNLAPYSSARDEYTGVKGVFLDANENPYESVSGGNYNRYPDPYQREIKEKLGPIKGVTTDQVFLGNGSDEAIDLVFRAFCEPGTDNVIILPPTYGMYKVCADINNIEVRKVLLTPAFELDVPAILEAADENTKAVFVCSPNNPTGNTIPQHQILELLVAFNGLVVIDEAYIDFASVESYTSKLDEFPNLIVLQTFSKAWGMAALRLGMAYASPLIISLFNKIKYPYNINQATQELALNALDNVKLKEEYVNKLLNQRDELANELLKISAVEKIYPSAANFLLVKVGGADEIYNKLIKKLVIVRNRSKVALCEGCLRISIGTKEENEELIREFTKILA